MKYIIETAQQKSTIRKHIYGHFAEHLGRCIYDGFYVGVDSPIPNVSGVRKDVIDALKELRIPTLRWPGGCFADDYHWMDGIGPKEERPATKNRFWGDVIETNHFGTHEFLNLCDILGCDPYIAGNVGSGTIKEMSDWVRYMTSNDTSELAELRRQNGRKEPWSVPFLGIGNENWGCGGNMRPEYYSDLFKQFSTYISSPNKIYKIACGPNADDYNWTEKLMQTAAHHMNGLSLHYYTLPNDSWDDKGHATCFDEKDYYRTLKHTLHMKELLEKHTAIMDRYDPKKRVGLIVDEWGTWYNPKEGTNPSFLYQQNTMRDAMVAAINLNLFNKHSDRIHMANLAQTINVLQAVLLTKEDQLIKTPTYHVFSMFSDHQEGTLLESSIASNIIGEEYPIPDIIESASINKNQEITITLCNTDLNAFKELEIILKDYHLGHVDAKVVRGKMDDYNTFENPELITVQTLHQYDISNGQISITIPPCSIVKLTTYSSSK